MQPIPAWIFDYRPLRFARLSSRCCAATLLPHKEPNRDVSYYHLRGLADLPYQDSGTFVL